VARRLRRVTGSSTNRLETAMTDQLFLYGVYSIHVRPVALQGARWDAEYEILHNEKTVQKWMTVGGDAGYDDEATAVDIAHRQAVTDIEHGAGIPKPRAFP
jgi:hypothetical protein